jgi:hypothetical protein
MRIAPFTVDITPPVGHPLAYSPNDKVDLPIFVRGLVVEHDSTRAVLAAAEIIGLYGLPYRRWRSAIAHAARVPVRNVLLHSVHQHDSLIPQTKEIVSQVAHLPGAIKDESKFSDALPQKIAAAVRKAVRGNWKSVRRVATAERRISGLASNRRLLGSDGKVHAMRWSMTTNRKLQREGVGRIDPLLRTIGFVGNGGRVLASLHFYATHPMGAYGRRMVSADIPGVALRHAEKTLRDGAQHIYFTGCAGDITFGKYTYQTKAENLSNLGKRLGEALVRNVRELSPCDGELLKLKHVPLQIPLDRRHCSPERYRKDFLKAENRFQAGWAANFRYITQRWKRFGSTTLTRLSLSPRAHVVSLPAETVVEYQLFAQSLMPEDFLACAAYADGTFHYLCTDRMFDQGGYEPSVSMAPKGFEKMYRSALEKLLIGNGKT